MVALSVSMLYNYSGFSVKAISESGNTTYSINNNIEKENFNLIRNEDNYIEYILKEDGKKLIYKENLSDSGVN